MKRALLTIIAFSLLGSNLLFSQDTSLKPKLSKTGYELLKEANELSFIKNELTDVRKKLLNLEELDGLELCNISRLIENISLVEIICRYEGMLLGIFHYIEEPQRFEQFKVHLNRLKEHTLKSLYMHYKATQAAHANLDDQVVLEIADKARNEMVKAAYLLEDAIKNMKTQVGISP